MKSQVRTLRLRLASQQVELTTCTTLAMRICVQRAIDDTEWQLRRLGA